MFRLLGIVFLLVSLFFSVSFAENVLIYETEIVVTASKLPQPKLMSPWDVQVIPKKDLEGKLNLGEALRETAGVDIKSSGYLGSVTTARLRGSTSQQVLILLNGRRINSPLLGLIDLGDVLLGDVEKIEVVRAPLSALYGADAVGGAVNIITKRAGNSFKLSYGGFNTQALNVSLANTSIGMIRSDGFRQNSMYTAQNISQDWNIDLDSLGELSLGVNYYNAHKGVPRVPNTAADPASASTPNDWQKDQNLFSYLSLKNEQDILSSKISLSHNRFDEQTHLYNFFTLAFEDEEYKAEQQVLELGQVLKLSETGSFSYGVEARKDWGNARYIGDRRVNNYAVYGEAQVSAQPISFVIGGRMDKHTLFGYEGSPRVGLSLQPKEDLIIRASTGRAFKAPTLNDLYWNDTVWQMFGSTALKPEKSLTSELGIEKKFGEKSKLSVNYFNSSVSNLIMWDWDIVTNITTAKNIGAVEVRGIEAEFNTQISSALGLFANYTYSHSEDTQDVTAANVGKLVPYSPETKYNLGLSVYDNIKLTASYVGRRYADAGNTIELPEYSLVGLWVGRKVYDYQLSLNVDNLFDYTYYESVGYHPTSYAQMRYPMPGRRITMSVQGQI
ncbi:MAG: TonB-dependent receptor [Candidatus Saganbacteria bacterium]|nr:TonB-dependent receptor [Candidatus Saganbacteria bacterium]